jgi:ribose 1,5-bisphosphokinase
MTRDMKGVLLYVIGPSGSGKDSLISYARVTLENDSDVVFAHRYITRPHDAGGENHVALSEAEFNSRLTRDLFFLHWRSHGMSYAIGCEVNMWLEKGLTVILNGSRAYLSQASQKYPELVPVLIEVSSDILRNRLHARGRESTADIQSRLLRAEQFKAIQHPKLLRFYNDAPLLETGPVFVALIKSKTHVDARV